MMEISMKKMVGRSTGFAKMTGVAHLWVVAAVIPAEVIPAEVIQVMVAVTEAAVAVAMDLILTG